MDWSGVGYLCIIVIVCLDSHSDGTHPFTAEDPLVSKWFFFSFLENCYLNTVYTVHSNNSVNIALIVDSFY